MFLNEDVANVNEKRSSRKRRATQDHTNSSIHSAIQSIEDSVNTSQNNSIFDSSSSNFAFAVATTGCRTWDEDEQDWVSTGCQVSEISIVYKLKTELVLRVTCNLKSIS